MDIFLISICIAAACISLSVLFMIKGKLLPILGLRVIFSAMLIAILAFLKVMPFNALIVGATALLGAPGLIASFVIVRFL